MPLALGDVEKDLRANDIGLDEGSGAHDAAIGRGFRRRSGRLR